MPRIRLIHWKGTEAARYLERLRSAQYQADYSERFEPRLMREWRASPPDAFVIDLSRLPSQGREIAIMLRQSPATRNIPLVFCEGEPEKVKRTTVDLPDATYCTFGGLLPALKRALAQRVENVVVPTAMMDRYATRTAAQKLGIKADCSVLLVDPPLDYLTVLGDLPPGVELIEGNAATAPVTLCFVHSAAELPEVLSRVRGRAAQSRLWILWRKGRTGPGDVSERLVRENALDLGLVDYKVCSVNTVWTGLLFAARGSSNSGA